MSNPNPAVVLGLNPNGLGIVRSLHAEGVPIIGVDEVPSAADAHRWMSSRTRLCRKVFYQQEESTGLFECLLSLGSTLPEQGVLLPSSDAALLCISKNRNALSQFYRFGVPEPDVVELLANKARFYPFADELGVPLPLTFVAPVPDDVEEIAAKIRYPCLIKPNLPDRSWAQKFPLQKAITANDSTELIELFRQVYQIYPDIVIQEIVPGPDSNLHFSHAYFSKELEPLAIWTGRKIRQRPIHFGTSTMTETVWVDEVADSTVSIVQALGCRGYASVEFKLDPRDGRFKIMEVTQGRTWYPHYLGFGAGVNIPYIWYRDLLGDTQAKSQRAIEGVRWIDEYRDILASYDYWKQGELTFLDWVRSFRRVRVFALASFKDPLPILFAVLRLILGFLRTLGRRLRLIDRKK